jgi:hypothetical protein
VREIGLMVLNVVFFKTEIGNPQRDRNRPDDIIDPLSSKWMTMNCLVLHAQVPGAKHAQEWNGQPRCQYFATHHGENCEPIDRNNYGERTPLTSPIEQ